MFQSNNVVNATQSKKFKSLINKIFQAAADLSNFLEQHQYSRCTRERKTYCQGRLVNNVENIIAKEFAVINMSQ